MNAHPPEEEHELTLAWEQIEAHQMIKDTGNCAVCDVSGPCVIANEAVALLVAHGIPVVEERSPLPSPERRAARLSGFA